MNNVEEIEPELEELLARFIKNQELMAFKLGVDSITVSPDSAYGIELTKDEVLVHKDGIPYKYTLKSKNEN